VLPALVTDLGKNENCQHVHLFHKKRQTWENKLCLCITPYEHIQIISLGISQEHLYCPIANTNIHISNWLQKLDASRLFVCAALFPLAASANQTVFNLFESFTNQLISVSTQINFHQLLDGKANIYSDATKAKIWGMYRKLHSSTSFTPFYPFVLNQQKYCGVFSFFLNAFW